ncbi:MAG: thioredoxin family protein [Halothiobacillus sp. 14-56-357]|jgi:peroxiredoxin|uniref:thioredoxin family protein n=1 Tax=Halothiobacillus sp. 15-55-196 TaxID=1970382 RepID=UPI000BCAE266|nr:thioredoxin family protein [Halothiobacillus sp. 15-55-196]OZB37664.1 MAG: thioredoxin family protein [Halothiobacillus sp. 15-55-196]OZB57369.1 MAG: thioredoxin family protein [Halothiobacillus sp. 14-56-357]OZB79425.1 MAG: thioredoxin family protein [Halothiobacillus sp. 13-55-115]
MVSTTTPIGEFNRPAIDFKLPDTEGRPWTLEDCRGPRGLLVMFICNHCPYVQAILPKIVRDTAELKTLGIHAVAIMSNDIADYPEDSPEHMRRLAREYDFGFPYLYDETQEVARAYGAVCTPDFFGYNADLKLQFRGRLDASGRQDQPDAPRELFHAMQLIAETGVGPSEQTPSIGCSIKWRSP